MRRLLLVLALTGSIYAQTGGRTTLSSTPPPVRADVSERTMPITHSDLYCAGFVGKRLPRDRFVAGGLGTPHQTRFVDRDFIFLRGTDYKPGTRVSIVREMRDPNRFDPFEGTEKKLLDKTGQIYGDIGYAVVVENRGKDMTVAQVEFSCENIMAGDLVTDFVERQPVALRPHSTVDIFPAGERPAVRGRIVAARDFEQFFGVGRKVYVNLGNDKGVKPGDYLRIVRGFTRNEFDGADAAVFDASIGEDTQHNPPAVPNKKLGDMPRHVVGEAVVLSTLPGSATAMVTFTLQEVQVGDGVEFEEAPGK